MEKLKTCRCCLKQIIYDEELHEFSSEVATEFDKSSSDPVGFIKISECYLDLTTLPVPENEEDMYKICSNCLGDLKFSFLFKKKCIENAKYLEAADAEQNG